MLELASKAIDDFKTAQESAQDDDFGAINEEIDEDHHMKRKIDNTSGYMGGLETAMIVFNTIYKLCLFKDFDGFNLMDMDSVT